MADQTENKDEVAEYLPFNAINEFMRDDYRLSVLHEVITHLDTVEPGTRKKVSGLISQYVKIPGFRKSSLAPAPMKAKNSVDLFRQSAQFSAVVVAAWASLHPQLKETVFKLLNERGWEPVALEVDRTQLPGYSIHWPKEDTFEVLSEAVRKLMPDAGETNDDISLMVVWIGNRLPYDLFIDDDAEKNAGE